MMNDTFYLKRAMELARQSVDEGGFPAGAVVVKDGEIVAEGISVAREIHDPTAHAEIAAIRAACRRLKTHDLSGATLYESIESCAMCFSVANWAGVSRIVSACRKTPEMVEKTYYEGFTSNAELNERNTRKIELLFAPEAEQASLSVIKEWESKR